MTSEEERQKAERVLQGHLSELLEVIRESSPRDESVRSYVNEHRGVHDEFFELAATLVMLEEFRLAEVCLT